MPEMMAQAAALAVLVLLALGWLAWSTRGAQRWRFDSGQARILESVSDAFVALDRDWRYTYVNARAGEMFGRAPASLLGKHIWTEFPEGIGQPFHRRYERAMAEQVACTLEEYYPPYDRWFENRIYPSPGGLAIYFSDITERKRAETLLQQERDLSNAVLDSLPDVFYLYDQRLRFRRWNRNFERVTGYTAGELAGLSPLDLFTPADRPLVEARIREVFEDGEARLEAQLVGKDGRQTPYFFTGVRATVLGETCLLGVGTDITSVKRMESAIQESADRLQLAVDAARLGTFDWIVPDNRIIWSRQHEQLWGFAAGEFDGTYEAFASRVHPDDLPGLTAAVNASIDKRQPFAHEFRVNVPEGAMRWVAGRGEFTFDASGQALRMRGVVVDVTDRRQAEAALAMSERRFRTLVDEAAEGILIVDRDLRYEYANPAACAMVGYTIDELLRMHMSDVLVPEEQDQMPSAPEVLSETKPCSREWCFRRKDGGIFVGEVNASHLPDGRLLGVVRDVTDRQRKEKQLRDYAAALRALTERAQSIREEEGTRIARELHDELGQALTGLRLDVSWLANRLQAHCDGEDLAELRRKTATMAGRIDATVQAVRRISSELRPPVLDDLGLSAAIDWQSREFEARTGILCHTTLPAEDPEMPPECANAMYRIFLEALTNVSRHARAETITIRFAREGDLLLLDIVDDGIGIHGGGRGKSLGILGMTERAAALGGTVTVASAVPRGTGVSVRMPIESQSSSVS